MTEDDEIRTNTLLQVILQSGELLSNPAKYNRQPGTEEIEKIKGLMDYCYTELSDLTEGDEAPTAPPENVDIPLVMGNGTVGETLTCTMGNWNNEPDTYSYAWMSDQTETKTGTENSYVIAVSDAGHSITCVVTATNEIGSTTASPSNAVAVDAAQGTRRQ